MAAEDSVDMVFCWGGPRMASVHSPPGDVACLETVVLRARRQFLLGGVGAHLPSNTELETASHRRSDVARLTATILTHHADMLCTSAAWTPSSTGMAQGESGIYSTYTPLLAVTLILPVTVVFCC